MTEIWKDIPEFEGRYQVSDLGRIRSFLKRGNKGGLEIEPRIMNPKPNDGGYPSVTLCHIDKRQLTKTVHQSVMLAFKGPPPIGQEVCHNNGIITDAALSNLRYDTHKNNKKDQNIHGTHTKGERNGRSKLTELEVTEIRELRDLGCTLKSIGDAFEVSLQTIHYIVTDKTWRAA